MEIKEFKKILDKFVDENCIVPGCKECHQQGHSVVIDGGDVKELFERIINNRIPVESSNIDFVSYNEEKAELSVWFKNRQNEVHYIYSKVPVTVFGELMEATSHGKYFQSKIRNVFSVEKIE